MKSTLGDDLASLCVKSTIRRGFYDVVRPAVLDGELMGQLLKHIEEAGELDEALCSVPAGEKTEQIEQELSDLFVTVSNVGYCLGIDLPVLSTGARYSLLSGHTLLRLLGKLSGALYRHGTAKEVSGEVGRCIVNLATFCWIVAKQRGIDLSACVNVKLSSDEARGVRHGEAIAA